MSEERKMEVVYNRWVLLIPIIMIAIGGMFIFFFWFLNPFLGLFGGALILVGIMVLGVLLTLIIALHFSVRSLKRQRPTPPPLSEELEEADQDPPSSEDQNAKT
jgi:flagellar basal body-associated protein FliL